MNFMLWVMVLVIIIAVTCAPPGTWLVLWKQPMLIDAISHTVLPGTVIAVMAVGTIQPPWPTVGAAVVGAVMMLGAELLESTGLVSGDGLQRLVFLALLSIDVLLLSTRFSGVQTTESAALVGNPNLVALLPLKAGNILFGPQHLWVIAGALILNVVYLTVSHTRLRLIAFGPELAQTTSIPVRRLGHLTMPVVSATITATPNTAGAVLAMTLVIAPAAIVQLLSHGIYDMYLIVVGVTVACSVAGFWTTYTLDASTSSGLAFFYGTVYLTVVATTVIMRKLRTPRTG